MEFLYVSFPPTQRKLRRALEFFSRIPLGEEDQNIDRWIERREQT
jgi:hypothetical protein